MRFEKQKIRIEISAKNFLAPPTPQRGGGRFWALGGAAFVAEENRLNQRAPHRGASFPRRGVGGVRVTSPYVRRHMQTVTPVDGCFGLAARARQATLNRAPLPLARRGRGAETAASASLCRDAGRPSARGVLGPRFGGHPAWCCGERCPQAGPQRLRIGTGVIDRWGYLMAERCASRGETGRCAAPPSS